MCAVIGGEGVDSRLLQSCYRRLHDRTDGQTDTTLPRPIPSQNNNNKTTSHTTIHITHTSFTHIITSSSNIIITFITFIIIITITIHHHNHTIAFIHNITHMTYLTVIAGTNPFMT
jgi:hypothetical protein